MGWNACGRTLPAGGELTCIAAMVVIKLDRRALTRLDGAIHDVAIHRGIRRGGTQADAKGADDGVVCDHGLRSAVVVDADIIAINNDVVADDTTFVLEKAAPVGAEAWTRQTTAQGDADPAAAMRDISPDGAHHEVAFDATTCSATLHEQTVGWIVAGGLDEMTDLIVGDNPVAGAHQIEGGQDVAGEGGIVAQGVELKQSPVGELPVFTVDLDVRREVADEVVADHHMTRSADDMECMFARLPPWAAMTFNGQVLVDPVGVRLMNRASAHLKSHITRALRTHRDRCVRATVLALAQSAAQHIDAGGQQDGVTCLRVERGPL